MAVLDAKMLGSTFLKLIHWLLFCVAFNATGCVAVDDDEVVTSGAPVALAVLVGIAAVSVDKFKDAKESLRKDSRCCDFWTTSDGDGCRKLAALALELAFPAVAA